MTTTSQKTITPLGDRIVVKTVEEERVTSSGLVIPDTAKERPQEGEVVAVGSGRVTDEGRRLPVDVAVGDRVLFARYAGTEVKIESVEYLILRETDILAKKIS